MNPSPDHAFWRRALVKHQRARSTVAQAVAPTLLALACIPAASATAMGLKLEQVTASACSAQAPMVATHLPDPPPLAGSQVVNGPHDILQAWLSSPTARYPHGALGSPAHAGSLHALVRPTPLSPPKVVSFDLPFQKVYEDRQPRIVDLDGDGRDEVLLIESELLKGSRLVVMGIDWTADGEPRWSLRATGPSTGSTFRWLNPVGVADFDADGQLDIASVTTPHIGGTLYLYRYAPPELRPYASMMDVSNHRMGALEQHMAAIVRSPKSTRPAVVVPDMTRKALHALRWTPEGRWQELADLHPLPATVEWMAAEGPQAPDRACMRLSDGTEWRITLQDVPH